MVGIELLFAFLIGVLSFLSPCIIPMIIVYLSTITGFSMEELTGKINAKNLRRRVFFSTIVFVASFTLVFTLVGGTAGFLGSLLTQYMQLMEFIGGLFLIFFGLHLIGLFRKISLKIPFLDNAKCAMEEKFNLNRFKREDGFLGYTGVFIVGFFFALVCSHCIGPTLYPIIIYAASTGSAQIGMLTLLAFSIGLGIPFIISGLFLGRVLGYLEIVKKHYRLIEVIMGLILILFGLLMVTGNFMLLSDLFSRFIPWKLGLGM